MPDAHVCCEFICGGCNKRAPGRFIETSWLIPQDWFSRADEDGAQVACSAACIQRMAADTGKTSVRVPEV